MDQEGNASAGLDMARLRRTVATRFALGVILWGSIMFLSAGTFSYWQGWLVLAIFSVLMASVGVYFLRHDPWLLERRMRYKEKEKEQKKIVKSGSLLYFVIFLLPGFDRRYGWPEVPWGVVVAADCLIVLAYLVFIWVILVNSYASRVIEVEAGQTVVTTGPYAHIRHPMYLSSSIILLCLPIALGSYWSLLPACLLPLVYVIRIRNEEQVLLAQLKGYAEYAATVKYRLVPGLWLGANQAGRENEARIKGGLVRLEDLAFLLQS